MLPRKVLAGLSGKAGAAAGFNAHTSRLVASKSTANSDLYQNADGSFTRRLAAAPINFRNPAGAWQPIVTTLAQQGPGRWAQQANSDGVSFAPTGASRLLTTVAPAPGQSVSTALAGGAAVAPVVSASTITYPGVRPGTDLVAYSTAAGARESLVLHSASAASSWVFPLSLQGLQPVPVPAAGGAVDLVTPGGKVAAFIPAGYADDSAKVDLRSGKSTATGAVSYQLTTYQGAPALQVTLDPAWLNDPARVFPVTVNAATLKVPTTGSAAPRVLPASAAPAAMAPASFNGVSQGTTTYAESQLPGDHSLEETMSAGSPDSGTHKAVSYVQFPGLGLDGSKITVSSASLNLAVVYASTCTAERFDVAQVTQPWTASGITAYPGPTYGSSIGNATPAVPNACANSSLSMTTQPDTVSVALSQTAIQALANGTANDYGLAIYSAFTDSLHWKQFGSDSYPWGPPVLSVTYTAGNLLPGITAQFPVDQMVQNTLTPTLQASGGIDCTLSATVKFDFQIFNTAGTKIVDSGAIAGPVAGACSGAVAWTVPAGDLKWGTQYYWTVQAFDGTNYSPGPVWYSMNVQVPQPAVGSRLSQNDGGHGFDPTIGNYTTSVTDANVATVGPPLSIVRDYNSLSPLAGSFGAAWSSVFDAKAVVFTSSIITTSNVVVTYPDGSQVGFGKNSDGTYTAPAGRFATLKSITGGFSLTDKNDTVYTFTESLGSNGYGITAITDSSGRSVNFSWTTASPFEITTMTSGTRGGRCT